MSRRSYKTINLAREVVEWIDDLLDSERLKGRPPPLGIGSRDEFVRIAVALLGAALESDRNAVPLDVIRKYVRELERKARTANE